MPNRQGSTTVLVTAIAAAALALCACGSGNGGGNPSPGNQVAVSSPGGGSPGGGATPGGGSPGGDSSPADNSSPGGGTTPGGGSSPAPQSPYDFELAKGFTSFSPGDATTATEEENAFKHVLFEITPGGNSYVIDGNLSPTPAPATVTPNSDGTTSIAYEEQTGGADSTSVQFSGTLSGDGTTMSAQVTINRIGGTVAEGTEYLGADQGSYQFTAPVTDVSAGDIPDPPAGPITCGFTNADGAWLTWGPPSAGPSASAYDIYEFVSTVTPSLFYWGHLTSAGLYDNTAVTEQNDASIISYLVYSVGPTGLDSLTATDITFDGVLPGSPPICSAS